MVVDVTVLQLNPVLHGDVSKPVQHGSPAPPHGSQVWIKSCGAQQGPCPVPTRVVRGVVHCPPGALPPQLVQMVSGKWK
jgi:hypothetical protein